jgi:hypothetical protein
MMTLVAVPEPPEDVDAPKVRRAVRMLLRPEATHLGHWNPTDAAFMHSPQIGLEQRWQEIPVWRSGCR